MQQADTCQACRRPATPLLLTYRKGGATVHNEHLLQCDVVADSTEVRDVEDVVVGLAELGDDLGLELCRVGP